jgi:hypothetical protein
MIQSRKVTPMRVKRQILAVVLIAILMLAALPSAEAQRPCAEALSRCSTACVQQFSGGFFGSVMTSGCVEGCHIGYLWCAASN